MKKQRRMYVCFLYHGFSTTHIKKVIQIVENRDKTINVPKNCFAYYYFDRTVYIDSKNEIYYGEKENISGKYFYRGRILTRSEVSNLPNAEAFQHLIEKEPNSKVLETPFNQYHLFIEGKDILLEKMT